MQLIFSLEGPNLIKIITSACQLEPFKSSGKPDEVKMTSAFENVPDIPINWLEHFAESGIDSFSFDWGELYEGCDFIDSDNMHSITLQLNQCVKIRITDNPPETVQEVLGMIATIPWTFAVFATTHYEWNNAEKLEEGTGYLGPMMGNLQHPLGWGCAFKGEGHKRLVSQRVLDYGPWRVIRDEANDITLVQFYDLNADADTALEQAKPGHEFLGKAWCGALLHAKFKFRGELNGIYQPDKRKLEIVVAFRELPLTEIIDACKYKYAKSADPDEPIDNVAFIFTASEEEARKYLFDIWLRGLECWAFIDHRPVRIDEDYTPPPPRKPEWVQKLEAQEI